MTRPLEPLRLVLAELAAAVRSQEWRDDALCAQTDPEAFFPKKGGTTAEAERICSMCEVRAECLEYALVEGDEDLHGVWGGASHRERRRLRKLRRGAPLAGPADSRVPELPAVAS